MADWFPKKERALATGIFNSGTNVGALVTPLVVPWIALHWGWQWAFILTGALGFLWVGWWLMVYRPPDNHPHLKAAELAYIRSDPAGSDGEHSVADPVAAPSDVGFCGGQIHDGSDLVALSVLDSGFPGQETRV